MQIPVLHDDQHGATIIVCATTCNGLHLVNKPLEEIKLVTAGAGAAALACLNLLLNLGLKRENVTVCDIAGVVYEGRTEEMDPYKAKFASDTLTDKLLPELEAWRERDLEAVYPIVWLDAIHYKIKENGRYASKAIYTILGLTVEGKKELLGLYLSDQEGAHHWLGVLTDLHNRGVKDILVACVDGLKGFPEAIGSIYPNTEVQLCIIHQIRNSLR